VWRQRNGIPKSRAASIALAWFCRHEFSFDFFYPAVHQALCNVYGNAVKIQDIRLHSHNGIEVSQCPAGRMVRENEVDFSSFCFQGICKQDLTHIDIDAGKDALNVMVIGTIQDP